MIGYVTIGMLDAEKSGRFYDAVMGAIGNERKFNEGGWIYAVVDTGSVESVRNNGQVLNHRHWPEQMMPGITTASVFRL